MKLKYYLLPVLFILLSGIFSCEMDEGDSEKYSLVLMVSGLGTTVPESAVAVEKGVPTQISAEPVSGYSFKEWSIFNGSSVSLSEKYNASTTVTLNGGDCTLLASFIKSDSALTLTFSEVTGGSILNEGSTVTVFSGESYEIEAISSSGYSFNQWEVVSGEGAVIEDINSTNTTITLANDTEIQALFLPTDQITDGVVDITTSNGGSVIPSTSQIVDYGESINISATPSSGYSFSGWSVTSGEITIENTSAAETIATLNSGNAQITASFTALPVYTLSLSASTGGSVSPSGSSNVIQGISTTLQATPASALYEFDRWEIVSGSGVSLGSTTASSTSVTLNSGNAEIRAVFQIAEVTAEISSVTPSNAIDNDHDNYYEALLISINVTNASAGDYYARIYYSNRSITIPQLLGQSDNFTVGPRESETAISYALTVPSRDTYNFNIVLYKVGNSTSLNSFSGNPLTGIAMEP